MDERKKRVIRIVGDTLLLMGGFAVFMNGLFSSDIYDVLVGISCFLIGFLYINEGIMQFRNLSKRINLSIGIIALVMLAVALFFLIYWKVYNVFTIILFILLALVTLREFWRRYKTLKT